MGLLTAGQPYYRAAWQPRVTAGIAPTVAAYSSPHVQSQLVTDHLHFGEHGPLKGNSARGLAKPSRAVFEGDCRSRFWAATHVAPGTPALVWPSTARRRALSPGNALPGTYRKSQIRICFSGRPVRCLSQRSGHFKYTPRARKRSIDRRRRRFFFGAPPCNVWDARERVHKRRYNG